MGNNDAAEMLEVAKAECERLEAEVQQLTEVRDQYSAALIRIQAYIDKVLDATDDEGPVIALDIHQFMPFPMPDLAERDATVARAEHKRICDEMDRAAAQWGATADRLHANGEHVTAGRYFNYASARRSVAHEIRRSQPPVGTTPERPVGAETGAGHE